jgi:RNA polymerase sigma factor (sigma-70 family)
MFISASCINDIINSIQSEYIYKEALIKYFPKKEIRDEFSQEAYLYILERPEHMIDIFNKRYFKYWFLNMVKNQVMSNSSSWHLNFRKPQQQLMENPPEETEEYNYFQEEDDKEEKEKKQLKLRIVEQAIAHFQKLDPKSKSSFDIFKLYYYEHLSIREISKRFFDTPSSTIWEHLKEAEVLIKHYINKYHKHIKN